MNFLTSHKATLCVPPKSNIGPVCKGSHLSCFWHEIPNLSTVLIHVKQK